jgi:hypothetical protein
MWLAVGLVLLALVGAGVFFGSRAKRAGARRVRDADVVRVVLGLDPAVVDELFELYGREFGRGAARYARRTRRKWQAGEVRPNRRTFERLLVRLPAVMSFDLKCEVLRKLRAEYCARDDYQLSVTTRDWRGAVAPLVEEIVRKSYAAELPRGLAERLKWLAADDMQAARAILAESEAREGRNALRLLEREFAEIERHIGESGGRSRVTHTIRLPLGTITLKIKGDS